MLVGVGSGGWGGLLLLGGWDLQVRAQGFEQRAWCLWCAWLQEVGLVYSGFQVGMGAGEQWVENFCHTSLSREQVGQEDRLQLYVQPAFLMPCT